MSVETGTSTARAVPPRHDEEGEDERSQVARTKPKPPERSQVARTKPKPPERSQTARTKPNRPNEANAETPIHINGALAAMIGGGRPAKSGAWCGGAEQNRAGKSRDFNGGLPSPLPPQRADRVARPARRAVARLSALQPHVGTRPEFFACFHCFSPLFFPVFPPVSPCSCASGFSLVRARPCIVIGDAFAPVNRLYFFPSHLAYRALRLIGAASRPKAPCRQGHRVELGSFGANPKAVESNSILKLEDVLMGGSLSVGGASLRRRRWSFGAAPDNTLAVGRRRRSVAQDGGSISGHLRRAYSDLPARGLSIWKVKCAFTAGHSLAMML
jgi:hypothetical protein